MADDRFVLEFQADIRQASANLQRISKSLNAVERDGVKTSVSARGLSLAMGVATTAGTFLGNVLSRAVTSGLRLVVSTMTNAIAASQKFQNTFIGLATVANKFGIATADVTAAAKALSSDGLLGVSEAAAGLKNLLASGFGLPEAIQLMNGFKDSAAFNRQASLGFGAAVVSATEGIKNQNSILVDNAGLTKNLSNIMKEAGLDIADMGAIASDAGIRAKFLGGLMKELSLFTGDAAKLTDTYSGATSKLSSAWNQQLLPALGSAITENEEVIRLVNESANAMIRFVQTMDVEKLRQFVTNGIEVISQALRGLKVVVDAVIKAFQFFFRVLEINRAIAERFVGAFGLMKDAVMGVDLSAQVTTETLKQQDAQAMAPLTATTTSAADAMMAFEASERLTSPTVRTTTADVDKQAIALVKLHDRWRDSVTDLRDNFDAYTRLTVTIPKVTQQVDAQSIAWLRSNEVLTNHIGLIGTVRQEHRGLMQEFQEGASGPGFFESVFGGGTFGGLNDIFQRAFEGGGGLGGAIQSFATGALARGLNFVPVIGPILSQFAGAFVAGFKRLFSGVGGFFKKLFGGPSEAELAGRDTANAWIDSVISTTNISSDRITAAVNEGWDPRLAEFALSAQDVWTAAGSTAEAAMAWTQRFFDAIKEGPGAVQPLIDEFMRMQDSAESVSSAVDDIFRPRTLDYKITGDNSQFINVVQGTVGADATSVNVSTGGSAQTFAHGGIVQAFPFGGFANHVPALVEPGEFVVKKSAVASLGLGTMSAINRGQMPGGVTIHNDLRGSVIANDAALDDLSQQIEDKIVRRLEQRRSFRV